MHQLVATWSQFKTVHSQVAQKKARSGTAVKSTAYHLRIHSAEGFAAIFGAGHFF